MPLARQGRVADASACQPTFASPCWRSRGFQAALSSLAPRGTSGERDRERGAKTSHYEEEHEEYSPAEALRRGEF